MQPIALSARQADMPPKPHVEELIRTTVKQTLLQLGLDVSDPEGVIELQKDFAYVRAWRISVDEVKKKGILTILSVVLIGIIGVLLNALKGSLH